MSALPPFACQHTPNFPELLEQLNCTLVISTFQAGKLIFLGPKNGEQLIQLPRTFNSPMGVAIKDNKLALATKDEVLMLRNSEELAKTYPNAPDKYDAFFKPMASYHTGQLDIHDLHFGNDKLWAVNTSFSCLCTINDDFSFTPRWKPKFISKLESEDRCHLNGLAMDGVRPKYVTGLGSGNTAQSWRGNITKGGVLIDIETDELICNDLSMPHSPRIYDSQLYVLLSAGQKLISVDPNSGKKEDVVHIPGFVRGMCKVQDYIFIATSKLRKNSSTFKHLEIADNANEASITAIHLPTGSIVAKMSYLTSVDEIYDIQILEGYTRPNIINKDQGLHLQGLITPENTFWAKESNKN